MKPNLLNYLIYLFALPAVGFTFMFMLRSATAGAHDGGFLGMVFGLVVGQIIFSTWLTNLRWYLSIPFGLLLAVVTIFISYWVIGTLRDIYNPIPDGRFYPPENERLENILALVFFVVLGLVSILFIEGVNKLTRRKN